MKKQYGGRVSFPLVIFLVLYMVLVISWGSAERETEQEPSNENRVSEIDTSGSIDSREAALDHLRSIGMSVFSDDDAVEAPDFDAMNLLGEEVTLSDFSNKVILMTFWATWCGPCKIELPTMNDLYADLKGEDFVLLAVNQQEEPAIVHEFIESEGFSFPVIFDSDGLISYQYGVRGIPTTYVIGTDGKVLAGKVGTHLYDGELYRSLFRQLM